MQWLFTTHARHYHEKYGTSGHVWQGRYKHCLVQHDHYLLTLLRYVERNALRANLVAARRRLALGKLVLAKCVLRTGRTRRRRPSSYRTGGHSSSISRMTAAELEAIRTSVNRQRPFGDPEWVKEKASEAGLDQSLVDVGRPRKPRSGPIC